MQRLEWSSREPGAPSSASANERAGVSVVRTLVGGGLAALILLLGASCASQVQVRTQAAPNARFAGRSTFRILQAPSPMGVSLGFNDPMLFNSVTNLGIREDIQRAFVDRGYKYSPDSADLDVAYYATAAPTLHIRFFNYGYAWNNLPREYTDVDEYEAGTVIIDVVDPATHELVWRGTSVSRVYQDPDMYLVEIRKAVDGIVKKFPTATPQATAKTGFQ